jgi:hypothetical protein
MRQVISEFYRAEQAALHAKGNYGTAALQYGPLVSALLLSTGARSLLDYGCGSKRSLLQVVRLPSDTVYEGYDPAIPEHADTPAPAELVCCIDVLEHIEPDMLDNVLDELQSLCDPYGFFAVHSGPAVKVLSDGRNAHLTQEGPAWWLPRLKSRFDVLSLKPIQQGFCVMVRSLELRGENAHGVAEPLDRFLGQGALPAKPTVAAVTAVAAPAMEAGAFDQAFVVRPPMSARIRAAMNHVLDRVQQTPTEEQPFAHLVVDDIFPPDYYQEMLANFPRAESLRSIASTGRVNSDAYQERLVVLFSEDEFARMSFPQRAFWREFASWMHSAAFLHQFLRKFDRHLEPRIAAIVAAEEVLRVKSDSLLVNDQTNYAIGPHTDAPHRLVSFLFYLPRDASMRELGTSLYRAKDPDFVCWGGPHHDFAGFERVRTLDFIPNRLVAFPKTERSFHGVERIERAGVNRPLLISNLRLMNRVTH